MKRSIFATYIILMSALAAFANDIGERHRPDLDAIRAASTDETSKFYYPRLLDMFLSNDTVMTDEEYRYFYYGTMYQEDYDPYRPPYDEARLMRIHPLYYQKEPHTNAEKDIILSYAEEALRDNPVDLSQLKFRIYAYDQKKKENLSKIWKSKLNHLLYVIASSGTGLSEDEAWLVVYPSHEFEFLNMQNIIITDQEYLPPHFEHVTVRKRTDKDPSGYYFDLGPMLEQYYLKHPSETE